MGGAPQAAADAPRCHRQRLPRACQRERGDDHPDQTGGPTQTAIAVVSTPANASGYRVGETIEVRVTFNLAAAVTGTPLLTLAIGADDRYARYQSGSGTASLTFRYPVLPGDEDADGLSVGASALTLNGGSIRLHGGTVSVRLRLASTITNNASCEVDGGQGVAGVSAIALNRPPVGNACERLVPIGTPAVSPTPGTTPTPA